MGRYDGTSGWRLETKARSATQIKTWKVAATNMARQRSAIYGSELLQGSLHAIEELRNMHISHPRKFPLTRIRHAWGTLNHRWVQEIKDLTAVLRLHAGCERPTFEQLKSLGVTIIEGTGKTVYQRPETFNL